MKINFLAYLDPFRYSGGGEMALRAVIEHGRRRGHEIRVFARRTGRLSPFLPHPIDLARLLPPRLDLSRLLPPRLVFPPADVYLLADLFNCPADPPLDMEVIERVISHERYIHFDNSYVDVCFREALPCGGDRSHCADRCGLDRARAIYRNSLANVFVSPLHHRVIAGLLGESLVRNPIIARPLVDANLFYDLHLERDIEYLYVGVIADYKGYQNLKKRFAGTDIVFIGRNITGEKLIGRHIPQVPHERLVHYYNRAKNFVHLPQWPEPQGRTVIEAALCGCKLITNEKVGATSFDFDITDRRLIQDAPDHLWREIERSCEPALAACGTVAGVSESSQSENDGAPFVATSRKTPLRINFVTYLDPFSYGGGGELTSRWVIERGRARGHRISVYARRRGHLSRLIAPSPYPVPPADAWLLSDVFNCPEDGLSIAPDFLERIVEHEPYFEWTHSYVDICKRPALPCSAEPGPCTRKCTLDRARWLFGHAIGCIFGSPLHYRVTRNLLGDGVIRKAIIWHPMIDTKVFANWNILRDIDYLYVGTIAWYKGYAEIKKRFKGQNIVFIGRNVTGEKLIGRHISNVKHFELPGYYNRAKYFVHLPDWPEPQGRNVVEAALCGCELITNDKVGATSFDFDISDPKIIADSAEYFWREIENSFKAL